RISHVVPVCALLRLYAPTSVRSYACALLRLYAPTPVRFYACAFLRLYAPSRILSSNKRQEKITGVHAELIGGGG
ncbi:uncharacterized, partial [Tachysurus ichikawai]